MEFKLKENNFKTLIDLIYLGNWLINASRLPNNAIQKYKRLSQQFINKYKKFLNKDYLEPNSDINALLHNDLSKYIEHYDEELYLKILAKNMAAYKYPIMKIPQTITLLRIFLGAWQQRTFMQIHSNNLV